MFVFAIFQRIIYLGFNAFFNIFLSDKFGIGTYFLRVGKILIIKN